MKDTTIQWHPGFVAAMNLELIQNHGYSLSCPYNGIYYINGNVPFPTQVIVTKELASEPHTWLRVLSRNISNQDAQGFLAKINGLEGKHEQEMADSILSVMLQTNHQIAKNWKGDHDMYMPKTAKVLMDIWEIDEEALIQKGMSEGIQKGKIQGTVDTLRDLNYKDSDIKVTIIKKYGLSNEEAEKYL